MNMITHAAERAIRVGVRTAAWSGANEQARRAAVYFRGAVRVYPTVDDLAKRCELRVLEVDPHADAIPRPGSSVSSIAEPMVSGA